MRTLTSIAWLGIAVLSCGCAGGSPPRAERVQPEGNDRCFPQREVHFVENGVRGTGVLLEVTRGFDSPFGASFRLLIAATSSSRLAGPAWPGKPVEGQGAFEFLALPPYRTVFYLGLATDTVRSRLGERTAWILGTNPLVLGLAAGEPQLSWRQYGVAATGAEQLTPVYPLNSRLVIDQELQQPLNRLIVFSAGAWSGSEMSKVRDGGAQLITLREPITIDQALDCITQVDPLTLGNAEPLVWTKDYYPDPNRADYDAAIRDFEARREQRKP